MIPISSYFRIMRVERWYKCIFLLVGALLASLLSNQNLFSYSRPILFGLVSMSCISFSNYVINEWFDRDSDRFHPINQNRVMVVQEINSAVVYFLYFLLLGMGFIFAGLISTSFFMVSAILALSGIIYNIKPLRVKDVFLLDVLVDSLSGPLRFLLGWLIITENFMPPVAVILCFWFGGAYLMVKKREKEYRLFAGSENIVLYRKSFNFYTAPLLKKFSLFYGFCFLVMLFISIQQVMN